MSSRHYRVHLEADPEGGYVVTVPALPGVVTWGGDLNEALAMVKEAIEGHIEVLREHGQPIPDEDFVQPLEALVQVAVVEAA